MKVSYLVMMGMLCPYFWGSDIPLSAQTLVWSQVSQRPATSQTNLRSVEQILLELEKEHAISFLYQSERIRKLQISYRKIPGENVQKTLDRVLKANGLDYKRHGKIYAIFPREKFHLDSGPAYSDTVGSSARGKEDKTLTVGEAPVNVTLSPQVRVVEKDVKGRVITAESGETLPGVSILIKGTQQGTISDVDGRFALTLPNERAVLIFSFVGYLTKEIEVTNQSNLDVRLKADERALEEVVVVGYGTVKKGDLTGSVISVSSDVIEKINTPSLNDALQGLAAGVQVTATEGRPGSASNIVIRGGSSISASNEPLYVIDGFPQLGGGNLDLNPQNIESIDILKDASAGAIYGARASNGVVIITTKSGSKSGKLSISYTGRRTSSDIIKKLETIDVVDYARIQKVLAPIDKKPDFENPESWRDSTSIDWQDAVYRNAIMQTHDLQITGGSKNSKYSASLGYLSQDGIVIGSDYSRINSRLRVETDISNKLTAGTNISYATDERSGPTFSGETSPGLAILRARPYLVGGPNNGDIKEYVDPDFATDQYATNVAKWLTENDVRRATLTFRTINYLEYRPIKGLSLRSSASMNHYGLKNRSYLPSDVSYGVNYNGVADISHSQRTSWLLENTANYKFRIGTHSFESLAGFSAQTTSNESDAIQVRNFPIENLGYDNLGFGVERTSARSDREKNTLASFFGRVNYAFANKYLLTATLRYDGSSNLGATKKWGAFPSVAMAWKVYEEDFIKSLNVFSDLKFRASYGITGNNSIGNYNSLGRYSTANISLNSAQVLGLIPSSMPNNALKWEQNKQLDIGLDMSVLKGRLSLTADYYNKQSKDLLLNAPIPYYSGFTTFTSNIGDIQSSGYELAVSAVVIDKKIKWTSQFNISFPSTRVLKLSDTDFFLTGAYGQKTSAFIVREGESLGTMYGYVFDGVNQNQEEVTSLPQFGGTGSVGGPRYRDISGPDGVPDGVINSEFDRTVLGNGMAKGFGGFTNRISYGNFDLSFIVSFRYGNKVLNSNKNFLLQPGYMRGGLKEMMNVWTPENPTDELWAWGQSGIEFSNISSWLVEDGSFARLNNITLGYSLPATLLKVVGINNFRFFISGDKLLTFSKYSGYDPEASYSSSMLTPGIDLTNYPLQKSFTLGLNITF